MPSIEVHDNQDLITNDDQVIVAAPYWVAKALKKLTPYFKDVPFKIGTSTKTWQVKDGMTLMDLVALGKNQLRQRTDTINFNLYDGINKEAVISLRDLVKYCVVVGRDADININKGLNHTVEMTICDVSHFQFQTLASTGRLVLLSDEALTKGILDDEIFQVVVGETKQTYQSAKEDTTNRFLAGTLDNKNILLDTKAYQHFVAQDFMLALTALNESYQEKNKVPFNFKFSKFSRYASLLQGQAQEHLLLHFTLGILKALNQISEKRPHLFKHIKRLELPFYKEANNPHLDRVLDNIQFILEKNTIQFACDDGTSDPIGINEYKTAMACNAHIITPNLQDKARKLNPLCNSKMQEYWAQYVDLQHPNENKQHYFQNLRTLFSAKSFKTLLASHTWPLLLSAVVLVALLVLKVSTAVLLGGVAAVFILTKAVQHGRDYIKQQQYADYRAKTDADLNQLNETQLESFQQGYIAALGPKQQLRCLFSWQSYRAPKAYYAGFEAKLQENQELKMKIKGKWQQKINP